MTVAPKCAGRTKAGARCRNAPAPGDALCPTHGGQPRHTPAQEAAAAADALAVYGTPVDTTPAVALLEEIRWTAGHVAWLRERVREVEQKALTVGIAEQRIDPDGGKTVIIKANPNLWLDLYDRERKHLVAVCAAALKAGVKAREIELAQQRNDLMAGLIRGILADLGLSPSQWLRVPEVVPRHLKAIGGPG